MMCSEYVVYVDGKQVDCHERKDKMYMRYYGNPKYAYCDIRIEEIQFDDGVEEDPETC